MVTGRLAVPVFAETVRSPGAPTLTAATAKAPALERLCRYVLRPPLALEQVTVSSGGQLLRESGNHLSVDQSC
jgi:hypothetical protein